MRWARVVRRSCLLALLAAAVWAAAGAVARPLGSHAAPASKRDPCAGLGYQVARQTRRVRVYWRGYLELWACSRISGKKTKLFAQIGGEGSYYGLDVAGDFVGYSWFNSPGCEAACPPGVVGSFGAGVLNARTGSTLRLPAQSDPVLVTEAGSIAWLLKTGSTEQLWVRNRYGRHVIDSGRIINVRISGHRLRWTRNGSVKSRPLR